MNAFKHIVELTKDMYFTYCQKLNSWVEIVSVENEVRKLSNGIFVDAFKRGATELSEITGGTYLQYLNEAKEMLLQGISKQDVMYHFDCILFDLKFGKSAKGGVE